VTKAKILIIDDDPAILAALSEYLQLEGYAVVSAPSIHSACLALENDPPDIAILDYQLPDGDALQFLLAIKSMNLLTQAIILTGHGTIDLAVKAIKEGAEQFITKPVQFSVLTSYVRTCVVNQQNRRKQLARKLTNSRYEKNPFQGTSDVMKRLEDSVCRLISIERPILIQGETGTGKGVLAQWIHANGPRADDAFVDVNCAGLSKELLESELFGHEKGAFTGAASVKQGLVEVAHRGILFLDEIGEMDITVQPKLLKVLEEKRFRRLGDVRERTADIQVIAATNRDLMRAGQEGRFREDLYFRINTFHLCIPPLRSRREDIPVLADTILRSLASDLAKEQRQLSHAAEQALQSYHWPGNIRELRNLLERVTLTCDSQIVEPHNLGLPARTVSPSPVFPPGGVTLADMEKHVIFQVLQAEGGSVAQAALRLGIPRSTLYQKIKTYKISDSRNQDPPNYPDMT